MVDTEVSAKTGMSAMDARGKVLFFYGDNLFFRRRRRGKKPEWQYNVIKQLTGLLTIKDLAVIHQIDNGDNRNENNEDLEDDIRWTEKQDHTAIHFAASVSRKC